MTNSIEIAPVDGPLSATVRPPGSKSLTNRALVCGALADGVSTLTGALDSEDTQVMIAALRKLGVDVTASDEGETLRVKGSGGRFSASDVELFVGNSGTTMRFLTAAASLASGEITLDGVARMRERPLGDLVNALRQLGVGITCDGENDCPPVRVAGGGLPGGTAKVKGNVSSQFLSGLLMAAPCAQQPVVVSLDGPLVSIPYVEMTLQVMAAFGVEAAAVEGYGSIVVPNERNYRATEYEIEPDASAASYFFAAAAIVGGHVRVEGLSRNSLQGDIAFCRCLEQMGCRVDYDPDAITVTGGELHGIDVDMNAVSDTVQTLAVVALFAEGPTRIRNVEHIRHKETDRITAVACELSKLGAEVTETGDGLLIQPNAPKAATINTYHDHRMAMSFSLAGLRVPGVIINDPGCTAKTYPQFFADFQRLQRDDA